MGEVKFYNGSRSKYNESVPTGSLYFATDTGQILLNGKLYGISIPVISYTYDSNSNTYQPDVSSDASVLIANIDISNPASVTYIMVNGLKYSVNIDGLNVNDIGMILGETKYLVHISDNIAYLSQISNNTLPIYTTNWSLQHSTGVVYEVSEYPLSGLYMYSLLNKPFLVKFHADSTSSTKQFRISPGTPADLKVNGESISEYPVKSGTVAMVIFDGISYNVIGLTPNKATTTLAGIVKIASNSGTSVDSGKVPALDSTGRLDIKTIPASLIPPTNGYLYSGKNGSWVRNSNYISAYGSTGFLVYTDLEGTSTSDTMFMFLMIGIDYTGGSVGGVPYNILVEGYWYHGTFLSTSALNLGGNKLNSLTVFIRNNAIGLFIPNTSSATSISIAAYSPINDVSGRNRVLNIVNSSSLPSDALSEKAISVVNTYNSSNSNSSTVDWNANHLITNGWVRFGGEINFRPPETGGWGSGMYFRKRSDNSNLSAIGAVFNDEVFNKFYLGWGANPLDSASGLALGDTVFTYKNNNIWHAGNFNPSTKLDADGTAANSSKLEGHTYEEIISAVESGGVYVLDHTVLINSSATSSQISTAIGGWDNLLAAISSGSSFIVHSSDVSFSASVEDVDGNIYIYWNSPKLEHKSIITNTSGTLKNTYQYNLILLSTDVLNSYGTNLYSPISLHLFSTEMNKAYKVGDKVACAGYADCANYATSAAEASQANYASNAGYAETACFSYNANYSNYSNLANVATNATYASGAAFASQANYANNANNSMYLNGYDANYIACMAANSVVGTPQSCSFTVVPSSNAAGGGSGSLQIVNVGKMIITVVKYTVSGPSSFSGANLQNVYMLSLANNFVTISSGGYLYTPQSGDGGIVSVNFTNRGLQTRSNYSDDVLFIRFL